MNLSDDDRLRSFVYHYQRAIAIAEMIVQHWEKHGQTQVSMNYNGDEPGEVVVSRALLTLENHRHRYVVVIAKMHLLLSHILEDDACAAGCNASYLDPKLKHEICQQMLQIEQAMKDCQQKS
jgi:hypothetical protein